MRKTQLVALAFVAVFAFSALVSASAYALTFEKAEFLVGGTAIKAGETVPIDALGEIRYENVLNGAAFTCSNLFEGVAEPGGKGSITKVFNLAGTEIKELPSTGIACTNTKTCESAVMTPDKLPFKVEAEQDEGKFYVLTTDAYEFSCEVIGIKIEELCEPPASSPAGVGGEVTNLTTDFEAAASTEPLSTCNGNAEEGLITNVAGNLTSSTAGNLSVSLPESSLTFEKAEFLVGGTAIKAGETVPIDALGEIRYENVLNGAAFTCSNLFEGVAEPGGKGSITKVFNLAGTEIKELPSTGIACTNTKTCESAVMTPDKLPFKVEAEQDEGKFYVLTTDAYEFSCEVIGIKIEELCEPPASSPAGVGGEVTNLTTDFEAAASTEPLSTCNGNAEEGLITNVAGNLTSSTAGNLSVSLPESSLTFEKAEFLVGGTAIKAGETVPIDALGEIRYENVLNGAAFTCSNLFEGVAEPGGKGSITKVFNLAGTEIKELPSTGIACTNTKTCESAVMTPDKLPFKVEAEQDEGKFYVLTTDAYEFSCEVIGIKIEELCEPPASSPAGVGGEVTNLTTDFEAAASTEPLSTCNGNAEEGLITNVAGNLTSSTAGNLAIS